MTKPQTGLIATSCALLAFTLVAFGQVVTFDFTTFDDPLIIYDNPVIRKGLTWEGLQWVMRGEHRWNWHPLTWFSHMLDCELYGLKASGHHATSLLLHVANVQFLWLVLRAMTGATYRSAMVAALFAIHPLNAEAVCWLAARKDLLALFFALLTLGAYTAYTRKRRPATYVLTLVLFGAGLLAKENLVTLPFVFLLLDYWPLGRLWPGPDTTASSSSGGVPFGRLVLEKVPFLPLVFGASFMAARRQSDIGAVQSLASLEAWQRVANAVYSYASYLRKALWPSDLAAHYTHPFLTGGDGLSWWQIGVAVLVLFGITSAVLLLRRRRYLPVGWFWFLGTLVPVIGLVQIGGQAFADRYFYLSGIGVLIMVVWGLGDLAEGWPTRTKGLATALGACLVVGWLAIGVSEIGRWRNGTTLWLHTVEREPSNPLALLNLGIVLNNTRRFEEATPFLEELNRIEPGSASAHEQLGLALAQQGAFEKAEYHYGRALEIDPEDVESHAALAVILERAGDVRQATRHFEAAYQLAPAQQLAAKIAWLLATRSTAEGGDGEKAVIFAQRALEKTDGADVELLDLLGVAHAAAGHFADAIAAAERAVAASRDPGQQRAIGARLALYREGLPFRINPGSAARRP